MPMHPPSTAAVRLPDETQQGARIKVVGVGGAGNNAINRMISFGMEGVEFIALNTDIQALHTSKANFRGQIGSRLTNGLGAGSDPDIGRRAALDDSDIILEALDGADMVFVTAGLGGGTGTGAAPVIAALASEMGALTVAIVTRPFGFEGKRRMAIADWGIHQLLNYVDTLIVIPNEKLLGIAKDAPFFESFRIADDFLRDAVMGISDILTTPGVINRDFSDVKTTMAGMGYAVMGTASRSGPTPAVDAVMAAMASPLLEAGAIDGARGILINITGSSSLRLSEVNEASNIIQSVAHEDANILFGAVLDERLGDAVKVTVIATGFRNDGRDRSARQERMNCGAEQEMPIIRAPASTRRTPAGQDQQSSEVPLEESQAGPDEPPAMQQQPLSDDAKSHDRQPIGSPEQPPAPESQEEREEQDWRDAIREIARLTEPDLQFAGHADDGPHDVPKSNDAIALTHRHDLTDIERHSENDLDTDDHANPSGVSAEPIQPVAAPQYETDVHTGVESAVLTLGAGVRQAAIAAYTTVPEPEPEPRNAAPATAFAEILETRRRFIESVTAENSFSNPDLQEGLVNDANSPSLNADVSPSVDASATEVSPKPLPEFNRRLHRADGIKPSWELPPAPTERRVRVPSFASGVEDDSYNDELDELDIPAFLRRGD